MENVMPPPRDKFPGSAQTSLLKQTPAARGTGFSLPWLT